MEAEGTAEQPSVPVPSTSKAPASIFAAVKDYPTICEGSLVIVYLSRDSLLPVTVKDGETTHTRYGSYTHSSMIGKVFGSKVIASNGRGFCHLLRPTPELWSLSLPHRTQILYLPDIAYISAYLDIKPGTKIIEAGTGSGSFSHSLARTVGETGKVFSFEFHEPRYEQAQKEFEAHGLDNVIELRHRNVCKDGFNPVKDVDAVFLDLPAPWEAIEKAKEALGRDRMTRICCFSPCIEQVTKTVTALQSAGFSSITMYETLVRQHDLAVYQMPTLEDAVDKLKSIESRKKTRRAFQKQRSLEDKAEQMKRKLDDMEGAAEEDNSKKARMATEAETQQATVTTSGDIKMEVAEETAASTREPTPEAQKDTRLVKTDTKTDYKKASQEERRYLSTKPAPQGRGHTSYLTFAFLMPQASVA